MARSYGHYIEPPEEPPDLPDRLFQGSCAISRSH